MLGSLGSSMACEVANSGSCKVGKLGSCGVHEVVKLGSCKAHEIAKFGSCVVVGSWEVWKLAVALLRSKIADIDK